MLRRKIEQSLARWKDLPDRKPLLIKGCRQCGKTFSVLDFAHKHYEHVIYLNFFQNPDYNSVFSGSLETDNLIMMISALLGPDAVFKPGKTVIVLDEIQECPEARTALKFFKLDGRFDVIGTGSLLGVRGYGKDPRSIPVGYETVIDMYPLDFEEFLWANGITEAMISLLRRCLAEEKPVPEALHNRFRQLLLQYTVVGGMPAVVQAFIDTHQLGNVLQLQRDIIRSYEDDMIKYADKKDKAKIAPLEGNALQDIFKVYMKDAGLLIGMLEDGTQFEVLQGNLHGYKGAIFENLVADFFAKMGRPLYYYHKDSGLEIDFVMRWKGNCTLVEVKATTGNTKSAKTILSHPEKYHVKQAVKLGDYNVGRNENMLILPLYMGFLLDEY